MGATALRFSSTQSCKPIILFYPDEARFGRIGREFSYWVRKDMIPLVARQQVREYIYSYSALSPQTGNCFSLIAPVCNTEAMNVFLQQLATTYHHYQIILLLEKQDGILAIH